ncbi:MAG: glycine cleavage system protein GcvH [Myxococcota bacterium]|nr:glycine cleavage system protein GcvH [Myxococcota bacterium]MEC9441110.1 glycine cleavage system protein GcvH [Myxococcota bacterium]
MEIPENLRYTASHEWARQEEDGTITIGITDHAQDALGEVVFVELPEPGEEVTAGEEFGVVESVKAASDVYSPIDGEVVATNEALEDEPGLVNSSPYKQGWFLRIRPSDEDAYEQLMDADTYRQEIGA